MRSGASFIKGLFGDHKSLDFPERAHKALGVLAEIRAMLEGVRELADDPTKPAAPADIAGTLGHLREFTRIRNTRCTNWCCRARAPDGRSWSDAGRQAGAALTHGVSGAQGHALLAAWRKRDWCAVSADILPSAKSGPCGPNGSVPP
jgi:hypothetical protein